MTYEYHVLMAQDEVPEDLIHEVVASTKKLSIKQIESKAAKQYCDREEMDPVDFNIHTIIEGSPKFLVLNV